MQFHVKGKFVSREGDFSFIKGKFAQICEQARKGKAERINRQPVFSTVSCCLPSLVTRVLRALH